MLEALLALAVARLCGSMPIGQALSHVETTSELQSILSQKVVGMDCFEAVPSVQMPSTSPWAIYGAFVI